MVLCDMILSLSSTDFRAFEVDLNAVNELRVRVNLAGGEVDTFGDFVDVFVDDGVKAAFREDVDQHRDRQRVIEDRVFGIHMSSPRQGMASDDR